MDHSKTNFVNTDSALENHSILSKFTFEVKTEAANRGKKLMHNKEQQIHEAYYKEILAKILGYDHMLLFGPTNAKNELLNYLKIDLHFKPRFLSRFNNLSKTHFSNSIICSDA
jgi:stalled ribosome rescue protein Dom34